MDLSLPSLISEGFRLLKATPHLAAAFGLDPGQWEGATDDAALSRFIGQFPSRPMARADYFFSALHAGLAHGFRADAKAVAGIRADLEAGGYPAGLFAEAGARMTADEELAGAFRTKASAIAGLPDPALRDAVQEKFSISYRPITETPVDRSCMVSKINHGYWEHFLSVHADRFGERSKAGEYRDLDRNGFDLRYARSGFDAALAAVLRPLLERPADRRIEERLSISFSAGENRHEVIMKRPSTPVGRGAMAGALSFFETLTPATHIPLGDGAEAKSLLDEELLRPFVESCAAQSDAILFVVPPHLAGLRVPGFKGKTYSLLIPGRFVHEAWRTVLPAYVALVRELQRRHPRLTVLTQSAVLAPVLGLAMRQAGALGDAPRVVRFFDLGRVLDVATPEVVGKQAWFKPYADIPIAQINPFDLDTKGAAAGLLAAD